jgi:excisionase family DNA binding protein
LRPQTGSAAGGRGVRRFSGDGGDHVEEDQRPCCAGTLIADIEIGAESGWPACCGGAGTARAAGTRELELLTVEEAAEVLHVSRDKAYCLIRTGQLRSIKIGKLRRISRAWIAEFVERAEARRGVH